MGDSRISSEPQAQQELHVLVTGFGPWASNSVNPSYLIACALSSNLLVKDGPKIHIHTVTEPVPVTYTAVRSQIPSLLFPSVTNSPPPTFDLVLFIGMASGSNHYKLETLAHRDNYTAHDASGALLEGADADLWRTLYNAPEVLRPGFDTEDVWRRWKNSVLEEDVRTSTDAGRFLCEFIYYTGLVEYWRRGTERAPVVFLHVPGQHDTGAIEQGKKVAEALVRALVVSGMAKGVIPKRK